MATIVPNRVQREWNIFERMFVFLKKVCVYKIIFLPLQPKM